MRSATQRRERGLKKALAETMLDVQRLKKMSRHVRRRYSRMNPEQKWEILRAVASSSLPVKESLIRWDVPSSTYYRWKAAFEKQGIEGLRDRSPFKGKTWNEVLPHERERFWRWLITIPTGSRGRSASISQTTTVSPYQSLASIVS